MKRPLLFHFFILSILLIPFSVFAQTAMQEIIVSPETMTDEEFEQEMQDLFPDAAFVNTEEDPTIDSAVSCFDYYEFGSVTAKISTRVSSVVNGTPVLFEGVIENKNPYPVVGGSLYARIFKVGQTGKTAQGYDVVDQFFIEEDIQLPSNGSQAFQYDWEVPDWLTSGEYEIATFFISNRKYNLLGLSFTDDIVGNTSRFSVVSEIDERVFFDKNQVRMNGERYYFAAFPPKFKKDEPVTIEAVLVNETDEDAGVPISYTTHYWDGMRNENKIQENRDVVTVPANGRKTITYTVVNTKYPVYFVEMEVRYRDTKSIIHPRFSRFDVPRARVNFPSIASYPITAGQPSEVFTCMHSTSDEFVENGKLELRVLDSSNELIHEYVYEGAITSDMMGVASTFVPEQSYQTFSVQTRLYQDGELIEEDIITYNCEYFGICGQDGENNKQQVGGVTINPVIGLVAVIVGGVLVLLILLAMYIKSNRQKTYEQ